MYKEVLDQFITKLSNVQHKYCGSLDENGFRIGPSCQQWFHQNFSQEYSGQFLYNNIQNKGIYLIDKKGDQIYYDGLFFCNKLEGYGKVVYANNTVFEGLFKQHVRFGPGVLTYPDTTQDVGMWDGRVLKRVMVTIGQHFVPRLGKTQFGRARLLKFRDLVPICVKNPDPAKDIFTKLTDDEAIIAQSNQLYNAHVKNPESLFFDKNSYYTNFAQEDCTIDVVISQEEFERNSVISQMDLGPEFSANEVIEDKNYTCSCFQPNLDRFGHISVQLNDVEMKLQALVEKKEHITQQLRTCKYCCQKMPWIGLQDIDKIKVPHSGPSYGRHSRNIKINKSPDRHSFRSSSQETEEDNENDFHDDPPRNEIQLQNYIYATSSITNTYDGDEGNLPHLSLSRGTLPFTNSATDFATHVNYSQPDINYNTLENNCFEEYEQDEFMPPQFPACLCNEKLIENVHSLQKQLEALHQNELFYVTIKNHLKNHLDLEFQKLNRLKQSETHFIKKVVTTHLLAWNNEEIWTAMLKHCFRHRSSEENVSLGVRDMLVGRRNLFKNPGVYETSCINFLEECSEGNEAKVLNLIRTANVNPDLCDARGNTGIMLATIRDKINVIALLANCGAKLDSVNDEGLTPLTVSLLKYLAFKFGVTDWEKAFLPETVQVKNDFQQWCPADSFMSDNVIAKDKQVETPEKHSSAQLDNISTENINTEYTSSEYDSKTMMTVNPKNQQKYIFKMEYIYVPHKESHKDEKKIETKGEKKKNLSQIRVKSGKAKAKDKKYKQTNDEEKKMKDEDLQQKEVDKKVTKKLISVKHTVMTLLNYGSDPNIGDVPLKPIFLAVFSDDSEIMYELLKNNADPNEVMPDENITSLHLIVSLNPTLERVRMCETLLNFNADPNIKTSADHWYDIGKQVFDPNSNYFSNEGKNALHLLSIREDFVYDSDNFFGMMASLLVFRGCKVNDLYLGHTPLSLAAFRGNTKLIEFLLDTQKVDPHQLLGNEMGNALTVLILNRFISSSPSENKHMVATALIYNGLNPLNRVGVYENVMAFIEHEHELAELSKLSSGIVSKSRSNDKNKEVKNSKTNSSKKSASTKASSKSNKSLKKQKKNASRELARSSSSITGKKKKTDTSTTELKSVENHIIEISRKILFRHLQATAVSSLYTLVLESLIADPLIVVLTKFFTPEEALNIISLLFQYGKLSLDQLNFFALYNFLTFIKLQNNMCPEVNEHEAEQIDRILKMQSMKKAKKLPLYANFILPEVDADVDKYKICYGCLRGEGKKLLKCPSCELVYFCSEDCNNFSNKYDKYHYCKALFYNAIDKIMGRTEQPNRLDALLTMANKMREKRITAVKLISIEERKLKQKLKIARDPLEVAEILRALKEVEKEKKDIAYADNLWDYGIVPSYENQQLSITNLKSTSSPKCQKVSHSVPAGSRNEDIQEDVNSNKSTNRRIYSQLPDVSLKTYRLSPVPGSNSTPMNVFFAPKPRRFPYTFTNTQSQNSKPEASTTIRREQLAEKTKSLDKNYYMDLLSKTFADFNLPLLLLPYACYKDGQVYYRMSENSSYLGFHKFNIPD